MHYQMMGAEAVRSAPPKEFLSMYYCIIKSTVHSLMTYFNLDLNFTTVNSYSFLAFPFSLTLFLFSVPVLVGECFFPS